MTIDLAKIRAAAEAATKGPWTRHCNECGVIEALEVPGDGGPFAVHVCDAFDHASEAGPKGFDADYIAALSPDTVLRLVAVCRCAKAYLAADSMMGEYLREGPSVDGGASIDGLHEACVETVSALRASLAGLGGEA